MQSRKRRKKSCARAHAKKYRRRSKIIKKRRKWAILQCERSSREWSITISHFQNLLQNSNQLSVKSKFECEILLSIASLHIAFKIYVIHTANTTFITDKTLRFEKKKKKIFKQMIWLFCLSQIALTLTTATQQFFIIIIFFVYNQQTFYFSLCY